VARVRPFRAYTYASDQTDISDLTAPPYDVISPEEREVLLEKSPHNVVALELPEGPLDPEAPDNRYETGARRWNQWREQGVLVRDEVPTLYVLEQRYELNGREIRRKAFIAEVGLEPFDAGIVVPHERTLPKALGDRFNLTRACAANFSQVFGLFRDEARATDTLFDAAMADEPTAVSTDDDGVVSTVWAVTDSDVHQELAALLADSPIFIADGHHRYTTALAYRDERLEAGAGDAGDAEYVMMALVNMDDPDLVVLPTHRVACAGSQFDPQEFYERLGEYFEIEEPPDGHPSKALDEIDAPAFLVRTSADERPRRAVLKDTVDVDVAIPLDHSADWKSLDVAVLQELVLDPVLGIHPDRPETLERLSFAKDAHKALEMAEGPCVAFVLRATRLDQLSAVALKGEIMPQKSTYFYPKLLSGLVLRGMD
jgi:uncharacterized protein (DUF1015 family)